MQSQLRPDETKEPFSKYPSPAATGLLTPIHQTLWIRKLKRQDGEPNRLDEAISRICFLATNREAKTKVGVNRLPTRIIYRLLKKQRQPFATVLTRSMVFVLAKEGCIAMAMRSLYFNLAFSIWHVLNVIFSLSITTF